MSKFTQEDPKGSLASVEAYLDEYAAKEYENTFLLKRAIRALNWVAPKTEQVKKLLSYLNAVDKTVEQGKKREKMGLFEECRKMFAPMRLSRHVLSIIGGIFGEVGDDENEEEDNEHLIKDGIAEYDKHKKILLWEAEEYGYRKLKEALEKLGHAIDAIKASMEDGPNRGTVYRQGKGGCEQCSEIQKLAGLAKEVMLREIFDLYGFDGAVSINY